MSGAGHDSQNFKDVCPCAMIFVRSVNGYSHRKEEYTPIEDCAAGANVLMDSFISWPTKKIVHRHPRKRSFETITR